MDIGGGAQPNGREGRPPAPHASPSTSGSAWRARVLLVDDEEIVHRALGRILGRGHEVTSADGAAALARFERGERFDLVLCDLSMPGISGIELYRSVGALAADQAARFVFLTGGALGDAAKAFVSRPDVLVVDKAAPPRELLSTVEERLARFGAAPASCL